MLISFLSLLLLAPSSFDYRPADKPLSVAAVRGFRPVETDEIVLEGLGKEGLLVFTGWTDRKTALYARTRGPEAGRLERAGANLLRGGPL